MKKNRILYIHANNFDVGGADFCLYKMAKEMKNYALEPIVLLSKKTEIVKLYDESNIKVIIKPILRFQKTKNPIILLKYCYNLISSILIISSIIKSYDIKIVHSNDLLDFAGSIAGRLNRIKTIQHIRMILPDGILKFCIVNLVSLFNDTILCVSNSVREEMFKNIKNAIVYYDWIDMNGVGHDMSESNLRKELDVSDDTKLVGIVGRLEEWKGQHIFIDAANIASSKYLNSLFIIVGGTVVGKEKYKAILVDKINSYSIANKVRLLGERTDIASIMKQLDIMVHSSITPDPFPGVVLEALYNGTPVVGANSGGVPEEIDDMHTGLLYNPGDSADLAKKIVNLLENDSIRMEMASRTKSSIMLKLNKEKLVNQLLGIYRINVN